MPPDERDAAYLWDMLRYAVRAQGLVADSVVDDLASGSALRLATERAVEIIGEAARRVSLEYQEAHPEIAWRQIVGLRNVIVHQYAEVNVEMLWGIVHDYVPELIVRLEALVPPPPER